MRSCACALPKRLQQKGAYQIDLQRLELPFFVKKRNNPGGDVRIRTGDEGFAGLCLTTWPRRHLRKQPAQIDELAGLLKMERTTGLEPATPTLARWCSTS